MSNKRIVIQLFKNNFKRNMSVVNYDYDMIIIESNHRLYRVGSITDYGKVELAINNGHTVEIRPYKKGSICPEYT